MEYFGKSQRVPTQWKICLFWTETSNFCEIQKLFHTERFTGDIITITNYQIIRDIF